MVLTMLLSQLCSIFGFMFTSACSQFFLDWSRIEFGSTYGSGPNLIWKKQISCAFFPPFKLFWDRWDQKEWIWATGAGSVNSVILCFIFQVMSLLAFLHSEPVSFPFPGLLFILTSGVNTPSSPSSFPFVSFIFLSHVFSPNLILHPSCEPRPSSDLYKMPDILYFKFLSWSWFIY